MQGSRNGRKISSHLIHGRLSHRINDQKNIFATNCSWRAPYSVLLVELIVPNGVVVLVTDVYGTMQVLV